MNSFKVIAMVCLVVAKARSSPLPQPQPQPNTDLFGGFLRNSQLDTPFKDSPIVKRRIIEDSPERELKQIHFASLIGDLEDSLFASALSAHKVINEDKAGIPEIKPFDDPEHSINKRQLSGTPKVEDIPAVTTEATEASERKIILQTTEKVPESNGVPAHIVIDRIAIQPHSGGVSLIPTFEVHHTSSDSDNKDKITKITISKTEFTSVPNTPAPVASSTVDAVVDAVSTTTPKNIEQLKEAEEELKEKVAEIEADPVILTARV